MLAYMSFQGSPDINWPCYNYVMLKLSVVVTCLTALINVETCKANSATVKAHIQSGKVI